MKNLKRIVKIGLYVLCGIAVLLIFAAAYHHIMLLSEAKRIAPVGTNADVDGYRMNVYAEGIKKNGADGTIVLLSGSGVTAPIYDYKILYSKLSADYRVAVVEKFGYGYSELSGISRDVSTMVEENRQALEQAGEKAPYILTPHSMSALEAIYWAITYPEEVEAIIGLDMAVPAYYSEDNNTIGAVSLMKLGTFFGAHRIPFLNPVSELGLSAHEIEQHKLLSYRNSLNGDVYAECKAVLKNAETVKEMGTPTMPILMFITNYGGAAGSEEWISAQEAFAATSTAIQQVKLDCGHNLHYYQSDYIAEQSLDFLAGLR